MRQSLRLVCLVLALLATAGFVNKSLTNDDVIKLTKAGIGDDAVIAKIRQAPMVDFRLETDDILKLKNAGVSGRVIAAMLDRSTSDPKSQAEPTSTVSLITSDGATTALMGMTGQVSTTDVYFTELVWLNFPGMRADTRTKEHNPSFLVVSPRDPRGRYAVVRLEPNEKDSDRSLKMGRAGFFSAAATNAPDRSWTFDFDSAEEKPGMWRLRLRRPFRNAGEYGIYVVGTDEIYDFGVD
ncbi:MAG TPA: hypothetical protein VLV78_02020 [Thermoanaerobaculia bacterium]|nr:hypothetical protein [Thermoanaerobaculia bacterium]